MKYRIGPAEMNNAECERIIAGTYHGVLSFARGGEPYAVPMNHAYEEGRFYFHCAPGGTKVDCIRHNPAVVYTIMKYYGSADDFASRQNCHGKWESIVARGTARYIEDTEELKEAFVRFMRYYGKTDFKPTASALSETAAIVMDVTTMTGRRELESKMTQFYAWAR
jgi:nitroimidazol reductase NimA-like FMN-containing flavoprotein (pyridoxamine 5'-phosphate oxidase superfamily)